MNWFLEKPNQDRVEVPPHKIVTRYVYPPIPVREFDWMAFYEAHGEEAGHYGYGKTEAEAVADLLENIEEPS